MQVTNQKIKTLDAFLGGMIAGGIVTAIFYTICFMG